MRLPALVFASLLLSAAPAYAQYYVWSGVCSACIGSSPVNQFYDDGLHGDGAAGDGLYGADITVDQPAGRYSWLVGNGPAVEGNYGSYPYCGCNPPGFVGSDYVWTTGPGDVIHFTLDLRAKGQGWQPSPGIACDHCVPAGPLQVIVPFSQLGGGTAYATTKDGTVWKILVRLPSAGTWPYVFSTADRSVYLSNTYNNFCPGGGCLPDETPIARVITTQAGSTVQFEFDEASGQMRAFVTGVVPARPRSWGSLKILYR